MRRASSGIGRVYIASFRCGWLGETATGSGRSIQSWRLWNNKTTTTRLYQSLMSRGGASLPVDVALLPNELKVNFLENGLIEVGLVEDTAVSQGLAAAPPDDVAAKKQKICAIQASDEATSSSAKKSDQQEIPESVLQYERQLRKVQASHRSVAELSLDKHLKIIYEDSDLIVADKPSGVLCVPGLYNKPNLLQLVCQKIAKDQNIKDFVQAQAKSEMIVHRLDMDTSGVVVFSKTTAAMRGLQATFRDRTVLVKEYHALLCGHLPDECNGGDIHLPLQRDHRHPPFMRIATPRSEAQAHQAVEDLQTHGFRKLVKKKPKPSHTEFRVVQREYLEFSEACSETDPTTTKDSTRIPVTRVALTPHTGRTHQLRVHCAALGYPIVGDPAYGVFGEAQERGGLDESNSTSLPGASMAIQQNLNALRPVDTNPMCLHAAKLGLKHPITGKDMLWTAVTPF